MTDAQEFLERLSALYKEHGKLLPIMSQHGIEDAISDLRGIVQSETEDREYAS